MRNSFGDLSLKIDELRETMRNKRYSEVMNEMQHYAKV